MKCISFLSQMCLFYPQNGPILCTKCAYFMSKICLFYAQILPISCTSCV